MVQHYYEISDLNFEDIEFQIVETEDIPPNDANLNLMLANRTFLHVILSAAGMEEHSELDWLIVLQKPNELNELPRIYAFRYLPDSSVEAFEYISSVNFQTWVEPFFEDFSTSVFLRASQIQMSIRSLDISMFYARPSEFLQKHAPRHYQGGKFQQARDDFLNRFVLLDSMQSAFDIAETQALWRKILDKSRAKSKPVKEATTEAFADVTGFDLPVDLKAIYLISNGMKGFLNHLDFMPLERVIEQWIFWKKIFDSWTLDELIRHRKADQDFTVGMYTNPRWIPLIEKYQAHYLGMDLMPGQGGKVGQIIHFGRDQDTIVRECESFTVFLQRISQRMVSTELNNALLND